MMSLHMKTLLCAAALASISAMAVAADAPSADEKALEVKYDWATRENTAEVYQGTCPVHIVPVVDQRQNKETLGSSMLTPLLSPPMDVWVTDGLMGLGGHGFTVDKTTDLAAPANGVTVRSTLTRAYTWQVGIKLFSMVALRTQFVDRNGVLQEKYYRAHGDKTNMWGADSEYATTLNYGINNLLPAIASDLVSLCKGEKVESYTYAGPDALKK
jgi:hypothetical protein